MNETRLRWKARIGASKPFAFLIVLFSLLFLWILIASLQKALKNPSGPQQVTIGQLARDEIEMDRYITVIGLAAYRMNYQETNDGKLVAIIYPLIDLDTGEVIFVKSSRIDLANKSEEENVTISGMTRTTPSDLKQLIQKDLPDITTAGLKTTALLYVLEGEKPGNASALLMQIAGIGLLLLLCAATFFFPSVVFRPYPLQIPAQAIQDKPGAKATGLFQQVIRMEPKLEFGQKRRKCQHPAAGR